MFKLEIETGGEAFRNPYDGSEDTYFASSEVTHLLQKIIKDISDSDGCIVGGSIMDINGNKVGKWSLD